MMIQLIISLISAVILFVTFISIPIGLEGGFRHKILNDICLFIAFGVPIIVIVLFLTCLVYELFFE